MAKPKPVVRLHPALPEIYRKKVESLADALNQPETASEAGEIIRSLIDRILLTPTEAGLKAEIFGDLVKLAQFSQAPDAKTQNAGPQKDPALLSVVAGTRNQRYLQSFRSRIPIILRPLTAATPVRIR
jgi:site-specific DNA recombinase